MKKVISLILAIVMMLTAFSVMGLAVEVAPATEDSAIESTEPILEQPEIWYAYIDRASVTIFWNHIDEVDCYKIYRKTDDSKFKEIATVGADKKAAYSDLNVENGITYTYAVVSVKGDLKSSNDKTYNIKFKSIESPKLKSAEMTRNGINVKWGSISGAEGYILYRRTENTHWEEIADFKGKVTSYEDTAVKSGETYFYTVKAYKAELESGCDYDGVSAMFLSVPELKAASNAAKGIKITWAKVEGANGYIIGRKTSSTNWKKIAETKDVNSYIDTTAKAGTIYTYTVVPVCDDVKGLYNENGITYKRISRPATYDAINTADGVEITWNTVSKCSGYLVYRKTEKGSWKRIAKVVGAQKSSYVDTNAKSGTAYNYKVVAYSNSYVSHYTEVSLYCIGTPELLSAKSGKSGVTAKWETVKGADGYYVYRKTGSGSFSRIATVKDGAKGSYLDKSAKKGKTYTYKVKAFSAKTTSAYSNIKKVADKY